jgi:hypothetical protein
MSTLWGRNLPRSGTTGVWGLAPKKTVELGDFKLKLGLLLLENEAKSVSSASQKDFGAETWGFDKSVVSIPS